MPDNGILVGCDQSQEWLLSWWWDNLQHVGRYPVAFADFGMTEQGRSWCRERGELLSLDLPSHVDPLGPELFKQSLTWLDDAYLTSRVAWFKKPHALLHTPYKRTLWLDLDCEVLAPLDPLFHIDLKGTTIALVPEAERHQKFEETLYNSGVILYDSPSKLISIWAEQAKTRTGEFRGDQELLSRLIFEQNFCVKKLPAIYNWNISDGILLDACIVHWLGSRGKAFVRKEGGLRAFVSKIRSSSALEEYRKESETERF